MGFAISAKKENKENFFANKMKMIFINKKGGVLCQVEMERDQEGRGQ